MRGAQGFGGIAVTGSRPGKELQQFSSPTFGGIFLSHQNHEQPDRVTFHGMGNWFRRRFFAFYKRKCLCMQGLEVPV